MTFFFLHLGFSDKDETLEVFVGDVTSYTLHNLLPGTTYDVKVLAQYDAGLSGALTGQGTTRRCLNSETWVECQIVDRNGPF